MINFFICRRRLLQIESISGINNINSHPINASSTTAAAVGSPFSPTAKFDSSMALTVLVLLTALFFMGLLSVYVRRLNAAVDLESPPPTPPPPPPPSRKGGLDPSAVRSLPLVAYGGGVRAVEECTICLSEFEERESVKLIPYCGHVFHAWCIDTWLSSHVTCPLCRSSQLFKRSGDEDDDDDDDEGAAAEGLFGV